MMHALWGRYERSWGKILELAQTANDVWVSDNIIFNRASASYASAVCVATLVKSYIRDTNDFLHKIYAVEEFVGGTLLVTMDVTLTLN